MKCDHKWRVARITSYGGVWVRCDACTVKQYAAPATKLCRALKYLHLLSA